VFCSSNILIGVATEREQIDVDSGALTVFGHAHHATRDIGSTRPHLALRVGNAD